MIIDTHCHYNLQPLAENWQDHWQHAQHNQVGASLIVGTSITSSQLALDISNQNSQLFCSVGLHPNFWQQLEQPITESLFKQKIEALQKLLMNNQPHIATKIIALGETGLDYFRLNKNESPFPGIKEIQIKSLEKHLQLASDYNLPTILHVRDTDLSEQPNNDNAYWNTLQTVKKHLQEKSVQLILHCFSGPASYIQQMVELGAYVGVAGNITYGSSDRLRTILKEIPSDKIILETDAPYLPPKQHRGQQCQPWMISLTADFLEKELAISKKLLEENSRRLFPQIRYN